MLYLPSSGFSSSSPSSFGSQIFCPNICEGVSTIHFGLDPSLFPPHLKPLFAQSAPTVSFTAAENNPVPEELEPKAEPVEDAEPNPKENLGASVPLSQAPRDGRLNRLVTVEGVPPDDVLPKTGALEEVGGFS